MEKTKWFIRRPHVIDQLRERAGFPADADSVVMEADLRQALDKAAENPNKYFLQGCKEGQNAVRIAIAGRNVVYAILKPTSNDQKSYDYVVPTVLDTKMYDAWNTDGKLGTVADTVSEKKALPKIKPQLHLRWTNGNEKEHHGDYCADDIPEQIRGLINNGVKRESIRVFKEIIFRIDVSLPAGITT